MFAHLLYSNHVHGVYMILYLGRARSCHFGCQSDLHLHLHLDGLVVTL
jgi:hypothetical protein